MKLNVQAHDLNRRLFDLCYDLGLLALAARSKLDFDAAYQFAAAVAAVKAAQAQLAESELVIDAARDPKDQSYALSVE